MLKKRFWLGMAVLTLVFGLTIFGCGGDDDGGGDESSNGNAKTITITGINGRAGEEAELELYSDNDWIAEGFGKVSNNSVTFSLINEDNSLFTESGSYSLTLEFYDELGLFDYGYFVYTNGQTWAALGITSAVGIFAKVPKYTISSARSTIAFSQFTRVPDNW